MDTDYHSIGKTFSFNGKQSKKIIKVFGVELIQECPLFGGFLSLVLRKGWGVDCQKEGKGLSNPGNSYVQGLRGSRVQTEAG